MNNNIVVITTHVCSSTHVVGTRVYAHTERCTDNIAEVPTYMCIDT